MTITTTFLVFGYPYFRLFVGMCISGRNVSNPPFFCLIWTPRPFLGHYRQQKHTHKVDTLWIYILQSYISLCLFTCSEQHFTFFLNPRDFPLLSKRFESIFLTNLANLCAKDIWCWFQCKSRFCKRLWLWAYITTLTGVFIHQCLL